MDIKLLNYLIYAFAIIGLISILSSFDNQLNNENGGVYAISTTGVGTLPAVYETVIDTRTGKIVSRNKVSAGDYNKIKF